MFNDKYFSNWHSKDPDQYYYRDYGGGRSYYMHIGNKHVPESSLDPYTLNRIRKVDDSLDLLRLFGASDKLKIKKQKIKKELGDLKKQIHRINSKIRGRNKPSLTDKIRKLEKDLQEERVLLKIAFVLLAGQQVESSTQRVQKKHDKCNFISRNPEQYYYKKTNNGKRYFTHIGNKSISRVKLDKSILDDINEYDNSLELIKLFNHKDLLKSKIKKLNAECGRIIMELRDVKTKINGRKKPCLERKIYKLEKRLHRERKQFERSFFKEKKKSSNYKSRSRQKRKEKEYYYEEPVSLKPNMIILLKYGITTKKEWKLWLLHNHPDVNHSDDREFCCAEVLLAGRKKTWD